MRVIDTIDLSVCSDCLVMLANGETDPNLTKEETAAFLGRFGGDFATVDQRTAEFFGLAPGSLQWDLVPGGCSDENGSCGECEACDHESEFSWSGCECCGSQLGGARYHAAALLIRR